MGQNIMPKSLLLVICKFFIFPILGIQMLIMYYPFIINKLHWCMDIVEENKGGYYLLRNKYDEHYSLSRSDFCRIDGNCKIWVIKRKITIED